MEAGRMCFGEVWMDLVLVLGLVGELTKGRGESANGIRWKIFFLY